MGKTSRHIRRWPSCNIWDDPYSFKGWRYRIATGTAVALTSLHVTPDDRNGSSRTGCWCIRPHDARQSTVSHGVGHEGRNRSEVNGQLKYRFRANAAKEKPKCRRSCTTTRCAWPRD